MKMCAAPTTIDVSLRHVSKHFGVRPAVDDVSLDIPAGSFVTLLGPSGCGKTTTLRMIGGFETPDSGEILIRDQSMANRPPHRRPTAMVFQHYALFPHMSVADNIAYGLKHHSVATSEIPSRVSSILRLVELEDAHDRRPQELSGGQQQRIALARALVIEPEVLLLDEPLGALDAQLRLAMQTGLKAIQQRLGMTFIYVTHDQDEALAMSDQIAIMDRGRLVEFGTVTGIYDRPQTRFTAAFMGAKNLLDTHIDAGGAIRIGPHTLPIGGSPSASLTAVIRPERIRLVDGGTGWPATVRSRAFRGTHWALSVHLGDGTQLAISAPHGDRTAPEVGDIVHVAIRSDDIRILS